MRKGMTMIALVSVFLVCAWGESRFGRPVIQVSSLRDYKTFKLDENTFASLDGENSSVSCIVYRGRVRYYVEIGIVNRSSKDIVIDKDAVTFVKPNYTVLRTSTVDAALDVAQSVSGSFIPTPAPQVAAGSTTTYSGVATTSGNQTRVSGTATTTPDNSSQAAANMGNSLGNALAARRFYNQQSVDQRFATYLVTFAPENLPNVVRAGRSQILVYSFEQIKSKKAPFEIRLTITGEEFAFRFKE